VGDGLQEGVLHLVQRAEPRGGLPLDLKRSLQVLMCSLPIADVPDEAREDDPVAHGDGDDGQLNGDQPSVLAERLDLDP
jgi:hypothetical protein